jgi:hypothetical protein
MEHRKMCGWAFFGEVGGVGFFFSAAACVAAVECVAGAWLVRIPIPMCGWMGWGGKKKKDLLEVQRIRDHHSRS